MSTSVPEGFDLKEKVAALSEKILEKHPLMPTLLKQIHDTLKAYPEQVLILSEEEQNIIINGLEHQTKTFLIESLSSKKSSTIINTKLKSNALNALGG